MISAERKPFAENSATGPTVYGQQPSGRLTKYRSLMSTVTRVTVNNSAMFHEVAEMVASGHRVEIGKGNSMFPMIRGGIDKIALQQSTTAR